MPNGTAQGSKAWVEWVRWGATALVIPTLIWAYTLQRQIDANTSGVEKNSENIASLSQDFKEDSERIRQIELAVVRMEGKIDTATAVLKDIRIAVNNQ